MGEETRGWSGLVNPNILVGRLDEMKLSSTSRTQAQIWGALNAPIFLQVPTEER